jgi:hypothetical protein
MAVPSEPRKRPKAPATELPSKGNNTMSKYIKSNMGTTKNQAITERPVIEQKWEIPLLISRVMLTHPLLSLLVEHLKVLSLTVEPACASLTVEHG